MSKHADKKETHYKGNPNSPGKTVTKTAQEEAVILKVNQQLLKTDNTSKYLLTIFVRVTVLWGYREASTNNFIATFGNF